jgi:N-acetyltransferase
MIGYTFLVRSCWGTNYNHEIKHLMLTHIYEWVNTVYFTVGANNVRSRKAMGRIGGVLLTPEQEVERKVVAPGSVVFEIRKEDFRGLI